MDAYKQMWGHEPQYHGAAGYNGGLLLEKAVREAGSLDSDKLRQVLLKTKTTTMFGDYQVDERGFQVGHKMVLLQYKGARIDGLKPFRIAHRGIGRTFQIIRIFPEMTALENLLVVAREGGSRPTAGTPRICWPSCV